MRKETDRRMERTNTASQVDSDYSKFETECGREKRKESQRGTLFCFYRCVCFLIDSLVVLTSFVFLLADCCFGFVVLLVAFAV